MRITRRGVRPQSDKLYHCKCCDSVFEIESEEDYDLVIPLSLANYEEYFKKATRVFVNCPVCGYRFVKEIYERCDGGLEVF